jgi:STELLO glycosyltransferases
MAGLASVVRRFRCLGGRLVQIAVGKLRAPDLDTAVVTSIQSPTASLRSLARATVRAGMNLFVIGDRKSPPQFELEGARFWSLAEQADLNLDLSRRLPENHYARKNIGYLLALEAGAGAIFDTDDDNAPLPSWHARTECVDACGVTAQGWVNAYAYFTRAHIWPRGLPLDCIGTDRPLGALREASSSARAPVQQGLANGSPDVDAIWRLVMDREFAFDEGESIRLGPGAWCPFNSQSTWWFPIAFPLLYLPSHVSFRMTDIWRSFVAQRCLWELGSGVVFHGPEMFQDRNAHDFLRDFEQEVPGYLGNRKLCEVLERTELRGGESEVPLNLHRCYSALIGAGIIPAAELALVEAWLGDVESTRLADRAHRQNPGGKRS